MGPRCFRAYTETGYLGMGKRRFTAEQARASLISAGVELLGTAGPCGVGSVTLAAAIGLSGVPRPSAYRVFGSGPATPQEAFHEALIASVLESPSRLEQPLREAVAPAMSAARMASTSEELTRALEVMLEAAASTTSRFTLNDAQSGLRVAALAFTSTTSRSSDRMREAVAEDAASRQALYSVFYRAMLEAFGLRLRDGWSMDDAIAVVQDATYGAVLAGRSSSDGEAHPFVSKRLFMSFAALVGMATEPDPDAALSAQPALLLNVTPAPLSKVG